ncbi:MAG: exonuclease SbcCD subunit D [Actinobacteria bacterium]|nr:exonuclease SbcCD subunit D [Actinomycetota bacterium]
MRILHTSDWHVGRRMRGRDRSEEHRAVLTELTEIAADRKVDLTLVAGDLFDTGSPTPVAEEIVWDTLLRLAEVAPVVIVAGNHDNPTRIDAVAPLLGRAGIIAIGAPRSPDSGGLVEVAGARIGLLPFVSQKGIVRAAEIMASDPDQNAGLYQERVQRVVERLTEGMGTDTVNLLVTHLTVFGAVTGGGERVAHVFGYAVPPTVFPGHLSYVALGHLHRQQKIPHPGAVWYSGSPMQLDFGEVDDTKGVLVVEAGPGKPATVTTVPIASGRRLVTVKGRLEEVLAKTDDLGEAYVKVVLTEKGRVGLADEVRAVIPDAVEVILESPQERLSDPEPRTRLDPRDAFSRYLGERGAVDTRVESLFAELLDEVGT